MRPRPRSELENPARLARLANGPGATPRILREKMRETFGKHLHLLEQFILDEGLKVEERLRAFEILAKYGIGTNLNHSAGDDPNTVPGVIALPQLDMQRLQKALPQARAKMLNPTAQEPVDAELIEDAERPGPEQSEPDDPEHGRASPAA